MPDVAVVGGGAIGCAIAYFAARNGASVTVLERGELAGEASGAAAGMLAALSDEGGDRGPQFLKLCLDGFQAHQRLLPHLEATGIDLRYRRSGVLHLAMDAREAVALRSRFEAQRAVSPGMTWMEGEALRREEPEVSPRAVAGMLSPEEHYLDPQRLVLALAAAARGLGADVRTEAPVQRFASGGSRLRAVRTPAGWVEAADFVLAAGPWTAGLARRLHAHVPVTPMRGQMLALGPSAELRHVIWGEDAYLVPRENRLTFVGATVEDVGFRKRTTKAALARLRRGAITMVPALGYARVASTWAGLRPGSPDGLPIMGRLPGWDNIWVATGHFRNGILLSAITGRLIADSIAAASPVPELAPFAPSRFAPAGAATMR